MTSCTQHTQVYYIHSREKGVLCTLLHIQAHRATTRKKTCWEARRRNLQNTIPGMPAQKTRFVDRLMTEFWLVGEIGSNPATR